MPTSVVPGEEGWERQTIIEAPRRNPGIRPIKKDTTRDVATLAATVVLLYDWSLWLEGWKQGNLGSSQRLPPPKWQLLRLKKPLTHP
jgi:hypothetical protein